MYRWMMFSGDRLRGCGERARGPEVPVHDVPFMRHEDQMDAERGNHVPATARSSSGIVTGPVACSGVAQVRYRTCLYPAPGQQRALARGCARVVYNDCLRLRDACHASGEVPLRYRGAAPGHHPGQKRHGNARGWARSRRWRWCRPAGMSCAPTGTGLIPVRQAEGAARSCTRRSGASTTGSPSGLPERFRRARAQAADVAKVGTSRSPGPGDLPSAPSSVTVIREPDRPVLRLVRGGRVGHPAARLSSRDRR